MCYMELKEADKAVEYFEIVISEFPEEKDVLRAKRALKKIGGGNLSGGKAPKP